MWVLWLWERSPAPVDEAKALVTRRVAFALLCLVLVLGGLLISRRNPECPGLYPPCVFNWATHRYCPGCGSARAAHSLLEFDLTKAVDYNALLVVSLPLLGYAFISEGAAVCWGRRLPAVVLGRRTGLIVVISVFAFWVLRNIPVYPLSLLAP